jgi:hypothetical protein
MNKREELIQKKLELIKEALGSYIKFQTYGSYINHMELEKLITLSLQQVWEEAYEQGYKKGFDYTLPIGSNFFRGCPQGCKTHPRSYHKNIPDDAFCNHCEQPTPQQDVCRIPVCEDCKRIEKKLSEQPTPQGEGKL